MNSRTVHLWISASLAFFIACDPPPRIDPPGEEGEGEEGEGEGEEGEGEEGEGEGEGEGPLAEVIERGCEHDVTCDFANSVAACIDDETEQTAKYASCEGFETAYRALSTCALSSCGPDCSAPFEALQALLLACVKEPMQESIDAFCARSEACFGENEFCEETVSFDLVRAGPDCTGAHDAHAAAVACLEDAACEDTIDCDPLFNAYFDELFFCQAGPAPLGESFPEDRAYLHSLAPPGQECDPAVSFNCFQQLDACVDSIATYIVTDIQLQGRYAELEGIVTLELQETGGETPAVVTFRVEDNGDRLVRLFDDAIFERSFEFPPACN